MLINYLRSKSNLILLILFVVGLIVFMWNNSYTAIWFDESFSIRLSQHSFFEIIELTSKDVHPPLYYILLKIYCSLFGYSIPTIRFFSLLPILLMILIASTLYRKILGDKITINFILLVILMPVMLYVVSEIRMYSWVMFFVFLASIFAYKVYDNFTLVNVFCYVLFSLAAAYTHNYGLITVFYIYCALLIISLIYKRNLGLKILFVGLIISILYLPWLIQLLIQMSLVKEQYWIAPINFSDTIGYIYLPWDFTSPVSLIPPLIKAGLPKLFFILLLVCFFIFIKAQYTDKKKLRLIANLSLLLYVLLGLTGILVSVFVKPVFIARYLICGLSLLFIAFSIYGSLLNLSKIFNKLLMACTLLVLLIISVTNFTLYRKWALERHEIQTTFVNYINRNITDRTAFLYYEPSSFPLGVYSLLFPNNKHYAYSDTTTHFNKLHQTVLKNITYTPIKSFADIDTFYNQIFTPENYEGKRNIMYRSQDSAQIMKFFYIKNKIYAGQNNYTLYELERRPKSE